jgi:hypothetical protein
MMLFTLTIAIFSHFGTMTTDSVERIAESLDRTITQLAGRNYRTTSVNNKSSQRNGQQPEEEEFRSSGFVATTQAGIYLESNDLIEGTKRVYCLAFEKPFKGRFENGSWKLVNDPLPSDPSRMLEGSVKGAFRGSLSFADKSLSEIRQSKQFDAQCLRLNKQHTLVNIRSSGLQTRLSPQRPDNGDFRITALVRTSQSGEFAICTWSEYIVFKLYDNDVAMHVVTKANVNFEDDRMDCQSIEQTATHYWHYKSESDLTNCTRIEKMKHRLDVEWNVPVKDEQLTLAYYGIGEEEYQKTIRKPEPPRVAEKPRSPILTKDQRDLALAIGIPVVLLAVLLLVIRKT